MDLDIRAIGHGELARSGHVAAEALHLRDAAEYARRGWLGPADPVSHGIERRQVARVLRHELAPELDRVHAGRLGQFIHETFHEDRVLVRVDPAPESRRHMRIAHRMVNQQVGKLIADAMLGAIEHPLEHERIAAFLLLDDGRTHGGENRLARQAHVQPGEVFIGIERASQLAHHDRVITALRHILFTRPDQLDRYAGHLLGDQDSLHREILECAAAPEPAPEIDLVDIAFFARQAGGRDDRGERSLGILRRHPRLAALGSPFCSGRLGFERGVVEERIKIDRLVLLRRACKRGLDVAPLVADEGLLGGQAFLEHLVDRFA